MGMEGKMNARKFYKDPVNIIYGLVIVATILAWSYPLLYSVISRALEIVGR